MEALQQAAPHDVAIGPLKNALRWVGANDCHAAATAKRFCPIGAAWPKRSNEGRDYLSVKLDNPSFTAPIFGNLFDGDDDTYNLIWSRGRRTNGD